MKLKAFREDRLTNMGEPIKPQEMELIRGGATGQTTGGDNNCTEHGLRYDCEDKASNLGRGDFEYTDSQYDRK